MKPIKIIFIGIGFAIAILITASYFKLGIDNKSNANQIESCLAPNGGDQYEICYIGKNPNPDFCKLYPSGEIGICTYTPPAGCDSDGVCI
jgi:hypothetical protein